MEEKMGRSFIHKNNILLKLLKLGKKIFPEGSDHLEAG